MRPGAAMTLVATLPFAATPAAAAVFTCTMEQVDCDPCVRSDITFTLNRAQFVGPIDPQEPPRRTLSEVEIDGTRFVAEAVLTSTGAAGFYEDAGSVGSRLMIVQPDGTARYTERPSGLRMTGTCTETR